MLKVRNFTIINPAGSHIASDEYEKGRANGAAGGGGIDCLADQNILYLKTSFSGLY